jgi:hypothetical protein
MTLTIELPPELEARLQEAAARHGQDPVAFAAAALADTLNDVSSNIAALESDTTYGALPPMRLTELDAALDELEIIGAGILANDEGITHSRQDIYFDHD